MARRATSIMLSVQLSIIRVRVMQPSIPAASRSAVESAERAANQTITKRPKRPTSGATRNATVKRPRQRHRRATNG